MSLHRPVRGASPSPARRSPRRRAEAGLSMVDVTVALSVLTLVVLGHVSSTLTQHRLAAAQTMRSTVLRVAGQVWEHLRSDEDWAGLYGRLQYLQSRVDVSGLAGATLADGRRTYPLTTYVPDIDAPPGLTALLEVPVGTDRLTGAPALREDAVHAEFLLPADLNGDGRVDDGSRTSDYIFLPAKLTLRWERPGVGGREQFSMLAYLRGER